MEAPRNACGSQAARLEARVRRARRLAGLAVLLAAGIGILSCLGTRAGSRHSGSLVRLPLPRGEFRQARGVARPSLVLDAGKSLTWIIPSGPRRIFEAAFLVESGTTPESEGRLTAGLSLAGAPARPVEEENREVRGPIGVAPEWQTWRFAIPSIRRPGSLRISYAAARRGHWAPPVTLGQPILSAGPGRPGRLVVLFLVDTLRRDHLSGYGYPRPTTPQMDRFFSRGTVWDRCWSNSSWTLASHATIFTSTSPMEHGMGEERLKLPAELPTLAEAFASAGYRTLAITNGGYVDSSFGFGRGFDVYTAADESVDAEVRRALSLLDESRGEPVFLFFHTYQVHSYEATPEAARQLFGPDSGSGKSWTAPLSALFGFGWESGFERTVLVNRYDAALRTVDNAFGRFINGLDELGWLKGAALVLTSDHGEEIMDRPMPPGGDRFLGHIHPFLYDEYLAVPLMARLPGGGSPRRVSSDVSLVDLAPTILAAAGIAAPQGFEGRNLLSGEAGSAGEEVVVSKAPRFDALAVRIGAHKLISRPGFPLTSWEDGAAFGSPPAQECFDVSRDPGETAPAPCSQEWARELFRQRDRAVAESLAGSLVLRFPERWAGRQFAVRASGEGQVPGVTAFGEDPLDQFDLGNGRASARFKVGGSGLWVAIRPAPGAREVRLEIFGPKENDIRTPGRPEMRLTGGWMPAREVLWRGEEFPEDAVALVMMPPAKISGRSSREQIEPEALVQLRSLGYLSSGAFALKDPAEPASLARFRLDVIAGLASPRAPREDRSSAAASLASVPAVVP